MESNAKRSSSQTLASAGRLLAQAMSRRLGPQSMHVVTDLTPNSKSVEWNKSWHSGTQLQSLVSVLVVSQSSEWGPDVTTHVSVEFTSFRPFTLLHACVREICSPTSSPTSGRSQFPV